MQNSFARSIVRGSLLLLLSVAVPVAYAQDSSSSDANRGSVATNPADQPVSVSLAGGQAIPLNQGANGQVNTDTRGQVNISPELRSQFLYGGTVSAVYMDNYTPNSITNVTSGVISPYVGFYTPTRTGGMTLQYLATVTPDSAFGGGAQAFHSLSFNAAGAFTHRWYWGLASSAEYGSEAARFEGPLTYSLVGLIPVVDPVASGAFFQGRDAAFAQNVAKLGFRQSRRDRYELSAYHTFTDLSSTSLGGGFPADRSNSIGAKLDYAHDISSRVTFHVYGQEDHVIESSCNTYGGGVGVSARLSYSWYLDASAGPQWTSANCGSQQNANFYGALVKALRGQAKVYAVGWRYFSTAFQTTSTWQDAVAVGFLQPVGRFAVQGDAGYFHGQPLLATTQPIQGYYASPLVRYRLTGNTAISAGYRFFHATGGNTVPGSLQYAMVSLEWRPRPIPLGGLRFGR
jgi:hypothetical protein